MRPGDVGCGYFKKLLWGALFRLSINKNSKGQDFYNIHNVIHNMIRLISDDICFCWEVEQTSKEKIVFLKGTRHMFVDRKIVHKVVPKDSYKKNLRTLIMSSKRIDTTSVSFDFLSDMKHARVIDLSHMGIDNVPDSIYEMKHLRLLNLSGNPFSKLPNLFGQLTGLETLKLENCDRLKQWPKDMKNIVTLRYHLLSVCFLENMPLEFGKLVNLETLSVFIQQLKDLDMLRGSICIVNLENVRSHDAKEASLHMKSFLEKIEFVWNAAVSNGEEFRADLCPHENLKELVIAQNILVKSFLID